MRFLALIERCAKSGFRSMRGKVIRPEGNEVYAIGIRPGPQLRIAGFYDDDAAKETFVLAYFYEKTQKKMKSNERDLIAEVARIKKEGDWRMGAFQ